MEDMGVQYLDDKWEPAHILAFLKVAMLDADDDNKGDQDALN
jgi:hypothetical protein